MFSSDFNEKSKDIRVLYSNAVTARKNFEKKYEELLLEGLKEIGLSEEVCVKESGKRGKLKITATSLEDKPYKLSFHRYAATSGNLCVNPEYISGMDIRWYKDIKEYLSKIHSIFEAVEE